MKLKALVIAGALLVAGAANAQESYVTNSFNSNLFVGLSAGANVGLDGLYGAIDGGKLASGVGLGLELTVVNGLPQSSVCVSTLQVSAHQ